MTAVHYDAEFLEDGRTIELISIGLVREDGAEYYAVSRDASKRPLRRRIRQSPWLMDNVVPSLPRPHGDWIMSMPDRWLFNYLDPCVKPREQIAREVADFILAAPDPELWSWYGAYDHVVLCQLWGRMIDLPPGVPMFTRDLKQECERLGGPGLPHMPGVREHNALSDAREVAFRRRWLAEHAASAEDEPSSLKAVEAAERIIAERDEEIARQARRCDDQFALNRSLREQAAEDKEQILALSQQLTAAYDAADEFRKAETGLHDIDLVLDGVPGLSQDHPDQAGAVAELAGRCKAAEAENVTLREALASPAAPGDLSLRAERAEVQLRYAAIGLEKLARPSGMTIAARVQLAAQLRTALDVPAADAGMIP